MMHLISIIMIAVGLSMDAFSLAILYGTLNFNKRKTLTLAGSVGVFHFFMPLFGNLVGLFLLNLLPISSNIVVGIIFFTISIQMLMSIFKKEEIVDLKGTFAIILFAFTVSIDSFSIGIALVNSNILIPIILFSITSFLFTYFGLNIGKKISQIKGVNKIGGILLIALSIYYLFT